MEPDVLQDSALRLPNSLRGLSCIGRYHGLHMASCFPHNLSAAGDDLNLPGKFAARCPFCRSS